MEHAQITGGLETYGLLWIYYFLHSLTRSVQGNRHQRGVLSVFGQYCSWTANPVVMYTWLRLHCVVPPFDGIFTSHICTKHYWNWTIGSMCNQEVTHGAFKRFGLRHLSIYCCFNLAELGATEALWNNNRNYEYSAQPYCLHKCCYRIYICIVYIFRDAVFLWKVERTLAFIFWT